MKSTNGIIGLFLIIAISVACVTTPSSTSSGPVSHVIEKSRAVTKARRGAIIGGIFGALLGAATNNKHAQGALVGGAIGAASGALIGYIFGKIQDKKLASRDEAIELVDYTPDKGIYLKVQSIEFDPNAVEKGNSLTAHAKVCVISPSPDDSITMELGYGVATNGMNEYSEDYIAGPVKKLNIDNGGGLIELDIPILKTDKLEPNNYDLYVAAHVSSSGSEKTGTFQIL